MKLRVTLILLSLIGLLLSFHLARGYYLNYFFGKKVECFVSSKSDGCNRIAHSVYASNFKRYLRGGIPTAVFGTGYFLGLTCFLCWRLTRRSIFAPPLLIISSGAFLSSVLLSSLGYIEKSTFCEFCLGVLLVNTLVLALVIYGFVRVRASVVDTGPDVAPTMVRRDTFSQKYQMALLPTCISSISFIVLCVYAVFLPGMKQLFYSSCKMVSKDKLSHYAYLPKDVVSSLPRIGAGKIEVLAIVDPLCSHCVRLSKTIEERLTVEPEKYSFYYIFAPQDSKCNASRKRTLRGGSCAVSEALLSVKDTQAFGYLLSYTHGDKFQGTLPKFLLGSLIAKARLLRFHRQADIMKGISFNFPLCDESIWNAGQMGKANSTPQLFVRLKNTDTFIRLYMSRALEESPWELLEYVRSLPIDVSK